MTHQQNAILMAAAVVGAFILAGGLALCNPANYANRAESQKEWAEFDERIEDPEGWMRKELAKREGQDGDEREAGPTRVAGAFYPEDLQEEEASGIDPMILAVIGGGLVFGLVGAGAFLMMGGLGSKEPEAPEPEPEDEFAGLVEIPDDPPG